MAARVRKRRRKKTVRHENDVEMTMFNVRCKALQADRGGIGGRMWRIAGVMPLDDLTASSP
jgi:hypothetical protein